MPTLSQRIKTRRLELKMSQKDLAAKLGVTQGGVAQMELGLRHPSLDVLPRLAKILTVSVDFLLVGEGAEFLDISALNAADRQIVRRFGEFLLWEKAKKT